MSQKQSNPLLNAIVVGTSIGIAFGLTLAIFFHFFNPKQTASNTNNNDTDITNNPSPNNNSDADITPDKFKQIVEQEVNFYCDDSDPQKSLVKISTPESIVDKTLFILATDDYDQSGWDKQKRCNHIANKLQTYKQQGILANVKAGEVAVDRTIYPVICVAPNKEANCTREKVLVTLLPNKNANDVLTALTNTPNSINVKVSPFNYHDGDLILNLSTFINNSN